MTRFARLWIRVGGLLVLVAGFGLPACCSHALEEDYGRSVMNNLAAQIVNPEAGQVAKVGVGQTPDAAANAYEKYSKSFRPEEKKELLKLTTEK